MSEEKKDNVNETEKFSPKFFDAEDSRLGKFQKILHAVTAVIETLVAVVCLVGAVE